MTAQTMYETLASLLGLPVRAIPFSACRIQRPYLLTRAGIDERGTAMLFTIPYLVPEDAAAAGRNLSLYAVARDYHGYAAQLREAILPVLQNKFPPWKFALFADHSPIEEVSAAARAGLGVIGLHHLLITPAFGSFVFICEVCTDADYETVTGQAPPAFPADPPMCDGCGACLRACPTQGQGVCLSALTQKRGTLTTEEEALLQAHELVWGCDTCQLACPHNRAILARGASTPLSYFRDDRVLSVSRETLAEMDEEAFSARAFAWRGRETLLRNIKLKEVST